MIVFPVNLMERPMFKKRARTVGDEVVRRKSIPRLVMVNALLGIGESEVMVIPDADMSYGMVRVRVWQANGKLEQNGETKRLTTKCLREGKKIVATEVMWVSVLKED
jgi:hypothetical protein